MPIPFACPHCQHETLVEDKYSGESGKCIACGNPITVPLATTQGAVIPQEKVDLTGGAAAGVSITCGVVVVIFALLAFSGLGAFWFWWGFGW
mgnify:CR=1 FL=1